MRLPIRYALLATLWLVPALAHSCGDGMPKIRVSYFNFPPFYYLDEQNAPAGELITLLNRIMRKAGCTPEYHYYESVPRLMDQLIAGYVDLFLAIRHPLLESRAHYGQEALARIHLNLYHAPDTPAANNLAELRNRRVIIIRGYGYAGLADSLLNPENGVRVMVAENHEDAFRLLLNGEGEYLLNYVGPAKEALTSLGIDHLTSTTWVSHPVFLIASADLAEPKRLLAALDAAARELKRAR